MPDDKKQPAKQDKGGQYDTSADQAEGERNRTTTTKVGRTPGQAEGERDPAKTDPEHKPYTRDR
ncbi:MAG: hypothetical protein HZC41_25945 [Chloroflexi bacterium]|nr:hypothetical protein [Chloroflexota bacterium]